MGKFFRGRIGIRNVPVRILLIVLVTTFFYVKFAYSQENDVIASDDSTYVVVENDSANNQVSVVNDTLIYDSTESSHSEQITENEEGHLMASNEHSGDELNRGKRFFFGILPFDREYEACVSCHYVNEIDTFNWNPSAMEIAQKYQNMDFASFEQAIMSPSGVKMTEVHKDFDIAQADLRAVKTYLDDMAHEGYSPEKLNIMWLVGLIILILAVVWSLAELVIIKMIKFRMITVVILLGSLTWLTAILYKEATGLGRQQNYAPLQPIKFSHEVHAGINQTDCLYCHSTAEYGKSAGIPSANVCMNCHIIVREGTNSGKFEISKVVDAYENNKPIEWIRVHNLPDHVFFSHAQHVGAGKLDCAECHGTVEEMNLLTQHSSLSMGWCLDCHRTKSVQFVENDYYRTYKDFHDQITSGKIDSVTVEQIGGTDCMKCHY